MNQLHRYLIKKGDLVEVIAGAYKKQRGKVLEILPKSNRIKISGIHLRIKKRARPIQKSTQDGLVATETPIHISNVMFIDPKLDKRTRLGRQMNEPGKWVRYSKKSKDLLS